MELSVTVSVDLDLAPVINRGAGVLTSENVSGLLAITNRASRTRPGLWVQRDCEHPRSAPAEALRLLQASVTGRVIHRFPACSQMPVRELPALRRSLQRSPAAVSGPTMERELRWMGEEEMVRRGLAAVDQAHGLSAGT